MGLTTAKLLKKIVLYYTTLQNNQQRNFLSVRRKRITDTKRSTYELAGPLHKTKK
jgi:hypothetical protein